MLVIALELFNITDKLSQTLENQTLSAMDGKHASDMTVTTIHAWRNNDHFDDVWKAAHNLKDVHGCAEPALPRPRKIPGYLDDHGFTAHHSILPLDHYRTVHFNIFSMKLRKV